MPRAKSVAKSNQEKLSKSKKLTSQKIARKSAPVETGVKKRRSKPGRLAMREIKKYQKSTDLLMQKAPFHRKSYLCLIQSGIFWKSRVLRLSSDFRLPPFMLFKKQPKQRSFLCLRMQTFAWLTQKGWPWWTVTFCWPEGSGEKDFDHPHLLFENQLKTKYCQDKFLNGKQICFFSQGDMK